MKSQYYYKILLCIWSLLSVYACTAQNKGEVKDEGFSLILNTLLSHSVPELNVDALAGNIEDYTLLDAREEEEYEVSRIPTAKYVGYDMFSEDSLVNIDKSQPIVVYCSVGYRSEKITEKLKDLGYQEVYNLYGGIFEWVNQGNKVVTGKDAEVTEKVHAYDKVWGAWLKKGEKVY
jgi:rhodanese-related sulfurtransferase